MLKPVYICGDIHGNFGYLTFLLKQVKGSIVIQVGDFGIGFSTRKNDIYTLEQLNDKLIELDIILYTIRGNHDNKSFFTGEFQYSNLKLLKDYTVLNIEGLNYLFVGGAISIDRKLRTKDNDYWEDEVFILNESKLYNIKGIDVVITHSTPDFAYPIGFNSTVHHFASDDGSLLSDLTHERVLITKMFDILMLNNDIRNWYYGHFHTDYVGDFKGVDFHLMGINSIKEVIIRNRDDYSRYE